jgi:hypothetical protein
MIANDYTDVTAVVVLMISASAIWTIRWMAKVITVVLKIEHLSSINCNEIESDSTDFETKNSYNLHTYFLVAFRVH